MLADITSVVAAADVTGFPYMSWAVFRMHCLILNQAGAVITALIHSSNFLPRSFTNSIQLQLITDSAVVEQGLYAMNWASFKRTPTVIHRSIPSLRQASDFAPAITLGEAFESTPD